MVLVGEESLSFFELPVINHREIWVAPFLMLDVTQQEWPKGWGGQEVFIFSVVLNYFLN